MSVATWRSYLQQDSEMLVCLLQLCPYKDNVISVRIMSI